MFSSKCTEAIDYTAIIDGLCGDLERLTLAKTTKRDWINTLLSNELLRIVFQKVFFHPMSQPHLTSTQTKEERQLSPLLVLRVCRRRHMLATPIFLPHVDVRRPIRALYPLTFKPKMFTFVKSLSINVWGLSFFLRSFKFDSVLSTTVNLTSLKVEIKDVENSEAMQWS